MSNILFKLMAAATGRTATVDNIPNAFTFTDQTNVPVSTTRTSNTITVSGMDAGASATVTVTGGTYSKNSGGYTSASGTAQNNDTFSVRHTSSSSNSTAVNTTLDINGVSDTFTSTTEAAAVDVTPSNTSWWNDISGGFSGTTNTITITGINTTITLNVTFTEDRDNYILSALVNGSVAGSSNSPGNYNFTVDNGDTIQFSATVTGDETRDSVATVRNVSDSNTVLDTFGIDLAV
jgi:hypothetical protein